MPSKPKREEPTTWEHHALYTRVREAIAALPGYFQTETVIAGIKATDIHTLAGALGASIEDQVVATLNKMRQAWDPDGKYLHYRFIRQPQTFPDVVLARSSADGGTSLERLLGIELKGWFLLAKESEPNLRFRVSRDACNPWDLVVVVPWSLSQVISGRPQVFEPFIELARYAADHRNWWWEYERKAKGKTGIKRAAGVKPFPKKSDLIDDQPEADAGGNFGRLARTGIMDEYLEEMRSLAICGIRVRHWISFFAAFDEKHTDESVKQALDRLGKQVATELIATDSERAAAVTNILDGVRKLVFSEEN